MSAIRPAVQESAAQRPEIPVIECRSGEIAASGTESGNRLALSTAEYLRIERLFRSRHRHAPVAPGNRWKRG